MLYVSGRRTLARFAATVIPDSIALLKGLLRDDRVGRGSKILVAAAVAWIASPIDLIPEFVPVIGPLDDVVVTLIVLRVVLRRAGRAVVAEHWRGDPQALDRLLRFAGR